jgi:glycosyltransferase involved in cell wall biosynthesis
MNGSLLSASADQVSLSDTADEGLRGRDMLCFSHDWSGDPLSKTHLMRLLARHNRILWVNSIGYRSPTVSKADVSRALRKVVAAAVPVRRVERNIYVLHPLAIPAYGLSWARSLNAALLRWQVRRAMQALGFKQPINWVFNPAAALIAGQLGEELLIYYCVDEYAAFKGVNGSSLVQLERQLLAKADLVIVSANRLLQSKRKANERTVLVRHGVDYRHFAQALAPGTQVPESISRLPHPVIGYFGLIAEDWVDIDLLLRVARHYASGSLVLLGKVAMDVAALRALPNVHLLGRQPYDSLPAFCKGFDVALVPFPISEVTLSANPLKAREYLAAGLPVVSTPIPEVEVLDECRIGASAEEFIRQIDAALAEPGPSPRRSATMRAESWDERLRHIAAHIEEPRPKKRRADCIGTLA